MVFPHYGQDRHKTVEVGNNTYSPPRGFWKKELHGVDIMAGAIEYMQNQDRYDSKVSARP